MSDFDPEHLLRLVDEDVAHALQYAKLHAAAVEHDQVFLLCFLGKLSQVDQQTLEAAYDAFTVGSCRCCQPDEDEIIIK